MICPVDGLVAIKKKPAEVVQSAERQAKGRSDTGSQKVLARADTIQCKALEGDKKLA